MRVAAVIAVVGVILVGGCSDDESSSQSSDPPTTEGTKTDQQIADEAVLVASDLPDGWEAEADAGLDNMENLMDECGVEDSSSVSDDGDPRSVGNWLAPVNGFAGSNVEINSDTSQAEATLAGLRTPAGQECLVAGLAASMAGPGMEVGDVELVAQDSEGIGDDAVAYRATVPWSGEGFDVVWNSDMISIREGRALVFLAFGSSNAPIPEAEVQRLTDAVLDRIPSDL